MMQAYFVTEAIVSKTPYMRCLIVSRHITTVVAFQFVDSSRPGGTHTHTRGDIGRTLGEGCNAHDKATMAVCSFVS